jgi:hypothetical protein
MSYSLDSGLQWAYCFGTWPVLLSGVCVISTASSSIGILIKAGLILGCEQGWDRNGWAHETGIGTYPEHIRESVEFWLWWQNESKRQLQVCAIVKGREKHVFSQVTFHQRS